MDSMEATSNSALHSKFIDTERKNSKRFIPVRLSNRFLDVLSHTLY